MRQGGIFIGYDAELFEELQGGELTQGLMRSDRIVDFLPLGRKEDRFIFSIHGRKLQVKRLN